MRLTYVIPILGFCIALMASALSVDAKNKTDQGAHCPPGLAKKATVCVPPGQAKASSPNDRVGERIKGDYVVVDRPARYGLDPNQTYYRVGDDIFRVDRDTREVLDFIGAAAALLK